MIKTLEEAIEEIHWLGSVADVCVYRQTGKQCIGCRCKKFGNDKLEDGEP